MNKLENPKELQSILESKSIQLFQELTAENSDRAVCLLAGAVLESVLEDSLAAISLKRIAPGDREKAVELQDEAIAIATEPGMKPLVERVLGKREILKA